MYIIENMPFLKRVDLKNGEGVHIHYIVIVIINVNVTCIMYQLLTVTNNQVPFVKSDCTS